MPEQFYATEGTEFQRLLSMGFTQDEAAKLLHMKDHVTEQIEYREMLEESRRLNFMRWLIEHDRISR
jgi:rRNA processing protein Krr1/Pno1